MSARRPPTATGRPRSRFVAILVYTLQSCFPPKRWVAVLLPCAGALLFGLLAHAVDDTARERAFANVAAEGIFGAGRADRRARHRRLRARRRGARRARSTSRGCRRRRPGRSCSVAGWAARSSRSSRSRRPCALAAVVAGAPASAGPAFVAAAVGQRGVRRGVHRHRLPHPAHRGVVAGVRVPRRAAARRRAHRHRPALADVGVAGDLRRLHRRPAAAAGPRPASRQGGGAVVRLAIVDASSCSPSRTGGCRTCAWPARRTEGVC